MVATTLAQYGSPRFWNSVLEREASACNRAWNGEYFEFALEPGTVYHVQNLIMPGLRQQKRFWIAFARLERLQGYRDGSRNSMQYARQYAERLRQFRARLELYTPAP